MAQALESVGLDVSTPDNNTDSNVLPDASLNATISKRVGYAPIKQEFLVTDHKPKLHTEYLSSDAKDKFESVNSNSLTNINVSTEKQTLSDDESEPPQKKAKLKGRNKQRPKNKKMEAKDRLCPSVKDNRECRFGDKCKFSHDKEDFVSKKLPELDGSCYIFDTYGYCPYGISCRFAKNHITQDLQNITNEDLFNKTKNVKFLNELTFLVRNKLWKRKYDFKKADEIVKKNEKNVKDDKSLTCAEADMKNSSTSYNVINVEIGVDGVTKENILHPDGFSAENSTVLVTDTDKVTVNVTLSASKEISDQRTIGCITDEEMIKLRPSEIKKIDFKNKLYLAPLTTVGNLPFRRICKTFGADITCGEMALVTQLLKAKQSEWSLIKRHPSEDIFGVQICGSYADTMTRCAQLLTETCNVDFIDINCGCPIDLIYQKGSGSALLGKVSKLEQICHNMISVMGNIPLTVKLRTGVFDNKNVAHNIVQRLRDAGVSLVTVHGRSREQRYTRLADWNYISQCAAAASPMPIFGNGDILSYEEANLHMSSHGVSGMMIARGALIKPWIFTEIKEQRHWDISSSERYDILKTYTNYGLEHWGSDYQGVENTRRFLLEWLSFLHRYIPVGVLEQVPQRINECPPYYVGRNDLETLMASANCADWIKISEMLLGPVPNNFQFLPKHKANAYQ